VHEVPLTPLPPDRFDSLDLPGTVLAEFGEALARARRALADRTLWHVSSTATGGGVAEMLQSVLCYVLGAGIQTRWAVVEGNDDFFVVTKRIHHMLHGRPGDGGPLGDSERALYLAALEADTSALLEVVRDGDVVFLHDPQTAGLAGPLEDAGAHVLWICHVGVDEPDETARRAWRFLIEHVRRCDAQVFSRPQYVWEGLDGRVAIVPPCLDAFSPKNQPLDSAAVAAILDRAGLVPDGGGEPAFVRQDGERAQVSSQAQMLEDAPVPRDAPVVTQVSRWDPLKDHCGVMTAFAEQLAPDHGAHLVLAGPSPEGVTDDPEGAAVFEELTEAWRRLPAAARHGVHIASLPMDDVEENAAVVNALQRHAAVVVQKSLAEGFGLTVAEAMWKSRPVAASRVGGIQDQIVDGRSGVLVEPTDLPALGRALARLLEDGAEADRLGRAARVRVADRYLVPRYLCSNLALVEQLL
jgi:trehalose synthase